MSPCTTHRAWLVAAAFASASLATGTASAAALHIARPDGKKITVSWPVAPKASVPAGSALSVVVSQPSGHRAALNVALDRRAGKVWKAVASKRLTSGTFAVKVPSTAGQYELVATLGKKTVQSTAFTVSAAIGGTASSATEAPATTAPATPAPTTPTPISPIDGGGIILPDPCPHTGTVSATVGAPTSFAPFTGPERGQIVHFPLVVDGQDCIAPPYATIQVLTGDTWGPVPNTPGLAYPAIYYSLPPSTTPTDVTAALPANPPSGTYRVVVNYSRSTMRASNGPPLSPDPGQTTFTFTLPQPQP